MSLRTSLPRLALVAVVLSVLTAIPIGLETAAEPQPASSRIGATQPAATSTSAPAIEKYPSLEDLNKQLDRLARERSDLVRLSVLATTLYGHPLWSVELAALGNQPPASRPAILIVAGLDAMHQAGSVVGLGVAEQLAATAAADPAGEAGKLLKDHTVYVLPCMNPDRYERLQAKAAEPVGTNLRPADDDRDDRADEDPPEDLNGDGFITMMRVKGRDPKYIADPDEPRIMRLADPVKGETPVYELYSEGIDNDGDGQYNEDGLGGVDLAANYPHLYRPNRPGSGRYPLSEIASRALADFVIQHPNIAAVLVLGPHDNIVNPPAGRDRDPTGRGYRDLHPDDVALHGELAKKFRELTGLKGAANVPIEGTFHAWCYNQRGLPTFATSLWWPLEEKPATSQPTSQPSSQPASQPSSQPAVQPTTQAAAPQPREPAGVGPATPPVLEPLSTERPAVEGAMPDGGGGRQQRPHAGGGPEGPPDGAATIPTDAPRQEPEKPRENPTEDRRWLEYSDRQGNGKGLVPWTPFKHPTLGDVEIGGFVPGFKLNPPVAKLRGIIEKQVAFVQYVAGQLPQIKVTGLQVKSPGPGVFEIEFYVVNDGRLPTGMAMARMAGRAKPIIIRPSLPPERILGGPRMARIGWLAGSGGREKLRWLVRGESGEPVTFKLYHEPIGEFEQVVELKPTKTEEGGR